MKKILLVFTLLMTQLIGKAQRVTYNDLKFVLYNDISKVEDYLSYKKFEFVGIDSNLTEDNHYDYVFIQHWSNKDNKYLRISKRSFNGVFYESTLKSYLQSDYLKFRTSIIKSGFRLIKTNIENDIFHNLYKKGSLEINIFISSTDNPDIHNYDITLIDKKLNSGYE